MALRLDDPAAALEHLERALRAAVVTPEEARREAERGAGVLLPAEAAYPRCVWVRHPPVRKDWPEADPPGVRQTSQALPRSAC